MKSPSFEKIVLDNGITLLIERIPYLSTVAIGYWMNFGSREEEPPMQGSTHYIEHMMFKGTPRHSPSDIAHEIEYAGGGINALTGKELTCCYVRILPDNLPIAIDILSDIYFSSVFPQEEFIREKQVILEEIKDVEDTPEDLVYDLFHEDTFGKDGLGHPVLGCEETVNGITRDALYQIYRDQYKPCNLIVAVAGNPENHDLPALILNSCRLSVVSSKIKPTTYNLQPTTYNTGIRLHDRTIEKTHFIMGTEGVPYDHKDRFVYGVLDIILSGGMSSRLFQEVREKRGLVYDIGTENVHYRDTGIFSLSASTRPANLDEVLKVTTAELKKIKEGIVSEDETTRVKNQLRASIAMSLESVTSRMMKIARSEMYYERDIPDEEIMEMVRRVSINDLVRIANEIFLPNRFMFTTLGPMPDGDGSRLTDCFREIIQTL